MLPDDFKTTLTCKADRIRWAASLRLYWKLHYEFIHPRLLKGSSFISPALTLGKDQLILAADCSLTLPPVPNDNVIPPPAHNQAVFLQRNGKSFLSSSTKAGTQMN